MSSASKRILSVFVALLIVAVFVPSASAQARLSDKDLEHMMNNLKDDAKNFRPTFNKAVSKSTIRKTSQEKDAKALVQNFQSQTEGMLRQFQSSKKVDTSLPVVLQSARNIEKIKSDVALGPPVDTQWAKIRTELDAISEAFNSPSN
jgi:predicted PurR-regulated permease PerM